MVQAARYALVAYVRNPVGEFVESIRRELHPDLPHLAAHVTILPPRPLQASEFSALETLEEICGPASPFEIVLGGVETFVPVTPTIFIRVEHAAYRVRELHDKLNTGALACTEEWPYMPHLTIVKMSTEAQAEQALAVARDLWGQYRGSRRIEVKELSFVREVEPNCWKDLAGITLGRTLVTPHDR
jgi:2'-5' RNA ligase